MLLVFLKNVKRQHLLVLVNFVSFSVFIKKVTIILNFIHNVLKYLISNEGMIVMLTLDKYVDLNENYASYGNDGYYIDPIIILVMIADNLHYRLSFSELKEFVKEVDVLISKEELDAFLNQKMKENFPLVAKKLKEKGQTKESKQEIKSMEDVELLLIESRYDKDSCTLEYFKNYLDRRKKKCLTLFDIYEDIEAVRKDKELTKESVDRLHQLDIHFNDDGYVYYEDALRLAETTIFNVKDLYEKCDLANRLETYLDFKVTKKSLDEALKRHQEIYPKTEVQLLDPKYIGSAEFIPLSANQKVKLDRRSSI